MCSILTKYTNPQLIIFADELQTNKKMNPGLYSNQSYNIIIMNPTNVQPVYTNNILEKFEKYIGIVNTYKCINFRKENCLVIYIEFDNWYDSRFTQALHNELVTAHTISNSYTDNLVQINIGGYIYELILCKMKFC
jgi:hypothetical protein